MTSPGATLSDPVRDAVVALFRPDGYRGPPRTGIELEVLPVQASDGRAVPPRTPPGGGSATLPVLRRVAAEAGWSEDDGGSGLPRFGPATGGWVSYEPGGQIEYSSPPVAHLPTLRDQMLRVTGPLEAGMAEAGIRLLARGVDPANPSSDARLVLQGDRYPRQRAHYDRKSRLGRVMMLQSAAVHLNVDLGTEPLETWRAANRIAPLLVALFANSPLRCGAPEPQRSQRAALWRELDPSRTGVFDGDPGVDPVQAYEAFALAAESFLLGDPDAPPRPFRAWLDDGVGLPEWKRHLTTLFPEVRPRGYLELRSLDALPARWAVVAAAVTVALLHSPAARRRVFRRLPPASLDRLERAGRLGATDPGLQSELLWLHDPVQEGLAELGEAVADAPLRRAVTHYFEEFPARAMDPGTAAESWIGS